MVGLIDQLTTLDLKWVEHPTLDLPDGASFVPRAAIFEAELSKVVICTFPNHEMEKGLTTDINAARAVDTADLLIHLRSHAGSSLVGLRDGGKFRYVFAPETVKLGPLTMSISDLCKQLPNEQRDGWDDLPLTGSDLPKFDDMESFLNWWDFYPGKQRFEIINGQVHLAQGFLGRKNGPPGFRGNLAYAARLLKPKHLATYHGLLIRIDDETAICPDLVVCEPPDSNSPFVNAKACVLFGRPGWTDEDINLRVELLKNEGIEVAVLNTTTTEFTGQFGTKTAAFSSIDPEVNLEELLNLALE